MEPSKERMALSVSRRSILVNVVLSAFKLFAGLYAHSAAMVSDAAHSLSDVCSTVVVMIGIRLSGEKADAEHPYGHERFECVAAILLSIMLFAVGAGIGWSGIQKIIGGAGLLPPPGALALVAALVSIVVKEGMYWQTRRVAKQIGSGALLADAWHHRSDALSSVGSFLGILGARLGLPLLDPLACLVICLLIAKTAFDIFRDAIGKMTDRAAGADIIARMEGLIRCQAQVMGIDLLKTRRFGEKLYVDVEIRVRGGVTLLEAHRVAQQVHDAIEGHFPQVKHCMVHVNPAEEGGG